MGFLKRLFGGDDKKESGRPHDPQGIYLYAACDRCGSVVRVRADKKYDLNPAESGYVWHKTIVDSKCFQRMPTVVRFDGSYNVVSAEIEGGHYITEEEYEAARQPKVEEGSELESEAAAEEAEKEDDGSS